MFCAALTLAYFLVGWLLVSRHEIWRDEAQMWLLARESESWASLLQKTRYEGHTMLWHGVLFLITRVTHDPFYGNLANLVFATAAVALFLRFAPLSRTQRGFAIFGYFFLYEYGVIARPYALGTLIWFAVCALHRHRSRHLVPYAALLVLLAHVTLHHLIVATCLALVWLLETLPRSPLRIVQARSRSTRAVVFLALLVGIGLSFVMLADKPSDFVSIYSPYLKLDLSRAYAALVAPFFAAFAPVPQDSLHYWNSNLVLSSPRGAIVAWVAASVLAAWTLGLLAAHRRSLLAFILSVAGLGLFGYTLFPGFVRHWGTFYLLFIGILWTDERADGGPLAARIGRWFEARREPFLSVVLALQVVAALLAGLGELRYPFSASRALVRHVQAHPQYRDALFVADVDYVMAPVAAYLPNPIFFSRSRRFGTFTVWDGARLRFPGTDLLQVARDLERRSGKSVYLVLNEDWGQSFSWFSEATEPVAAFTESVVADERYYLFRLARP